MDGIFQISLIAAFIAGMVALFAPCCITFLLPAYLGGVFKEKEKVLLMTLIFGLGIFVVLLPAVLGIAFISKLLFTYHDNVYILGGLVMIIVSFISLLGIKPPMMHFPGSNFPKKVDVWSIFTLGIFSGITSACCAPVLIGILTLSFLSPGFFGATIIGAVYVLGMITPLLLISIFLSGKMPKLKFLRVNLTTVRILGKEFFITVDNFIAFAVFLITGILTIILASKGLLSMAKSQSFAVVIQNSAGFVTEKVGNNALVNVLFLFLIILLIYKISKKV